MTSSKVKDSSYLFRITVYEIFEGKKKKKRETNESKQSNLLTNHTNEHNIKLY